MRTREEITARIEEENGQMILPRSRNFLKACLMLEPGTELTEVLNLIGVKFEELNKNIKDKKESDFIDNMAIIHQAFWVIGFSAVLDKIYTLSWENWAQEKRKLLEKMYEHVQRKFNEKQANGNVAPKPKDKKRKNTRTAVRDEA